MKNKKSTEALPKNEASQKRDKAVNQENELDPDYYDAKESPSKKARSSESKPLDASEGVEPPLKKR